MSDVPEWLPSLVLLQEYDGDWKQYIEAVYDYFKSDFITSRTRFGHRAIRLKRYPLLGGKEATFWHITSEGETENQRIPDLRRCERIRWPRPIIEHYTDEVIRYWTNERRHERRIVLWFYEQDYVVVLADRKKYVLLWTTYMVSYKHTKEKLWREYEDAQND